MMVKDGMVVLGNRLDDVMSGKVSLKHHVASLVVLPSKCDRILKLMVHSLRRAKIREVEACIRIGDSHKPHRFQRPAGKQHLGSNQNLDIPFVECLSKDVALGWSPDRIPVKSPNLDGRKLAGQQLFDPLRTKPG